MSEKDQKVLQSKKFVAFLIAEVTWKVLAILGLFWGREAMQSEVFLFLLAVIAVAGFVEVGYIIGQGSLEKYLGLAQIAADSGKKVKAPVPKKLQVEDKTDPEPVE